MIEPGHTQQRYFRELWAYRSLVYHMARRDLQVRYAQTLLGLGWPLAQALLSMMVLTFVFRRVAGLHAPGDLPYPVLVLSGLLPWQLFATGITSVSLSMLNANNLLDRVYFPRLVLPIRALSVAAHNALVTASLLIVVMLGCGVMPSVRILLLPILLLMSGLLALALGLFLSVWNTMYRDFLHLLPFLLQLALYVSPVGFESRAIPADYAWVATINPLAPIIDGCRYVLLPGAHTFPLAGLAFSGVVSLAALALGIRFFRTHESDVVERL